MSTRFWCSTHLTRSRTYRTNGVSLNSPRQTPHRNQTYSRREVVPSTWTLTRVLRDKREGRLRWAHEHEQLTNRALGDVSLMPPVIYLETSILEPVNESTTIWQWAHHRDQI